MRNAGGTTEKAWATLRLAAIHEHLTVGAAGGELHQALPRGARRDRADGPEGEPAGPDRKKYGLVAGLYRAFLDHFPDDALATAYQFYLGEALWVLERWREAAVAYGDVVARAPDGKFAKEAAYAAVLAWKNALGAGPPSAVDAAARPAPLSDDEKKLMAAFDAYLRVAPDAPER